MLDISLGTIVILSLLAVGAIASTHLLKSLKFWKESYWNIPGACILVAGAMLIFELIAGGSFEVQDVIKIVLTGLLVGCAAGGLYKMVQGFQGK